MGEAEGLKTMAAKQTRDAERLSVLRGLWLTRSVEKRTDNDVLAFYGWLEQYRPDLLNRKNGDPYQNLKSDLRGHIQEKRRV
jgi:hypothetical protein